MHYYFQTFIGSNIKYIPGYVIYVNNNHKSGNNNRIMIIASAVSVSGVLLISVVIFAVCRWQKSTREDRNSLFRADSPHTICRSQVTRGSLGPLYKPEPILWSPEDDDIDYRSNSPTRDFRPGSSIRGYRSNTPTRDFRTNSSIRGSKSNSSIRDYRPSSSIRDYRSNSPIRDFNTGFANPMYLPRGHDNKYHHREDRTDGDYLHPSGWSHEHMYSSTDINCLPGDDYSHTSDDYLHPTNDYSHRNDYLHPTNDYSHRNDDYLHPTNDYSHRNDDYLHPIDGNMHQEGHHRPNNFDTYYRDDDYRRADPSTMSSRSVRKLPRIPLPDIPEFMPRPKY